MRARDVVGRKIVGVRQVRFWSAHTNSWAVSLEAIELDNGAVIALHAFDTQDGSAVEGQVIKPRPRRPKPTPLLDEADRSWKWPLGEGDD